MDNNEDFKELEERLDNIKRLKLQLQQIRIDYLKREKELDKAERETLTFARKHDFQTSWSPS